MHTIERLWEYNNWANELLFEAFEESAERIPPSCMRFCSHIVNVQSIWLNRLSAAEQVLTAWQEHDLQTCKRVHEETSAGLHVIIQTYTADLFVKIEFKNTQGKTIRSYIGDMLLQVFNHGTYHRAQIALEMRHNGLDPTPTDYIIFANTKLD